jgi:hypothetical protein
MRISPAGYTEGFKKRLSIHLKTKEAPVKKNKWDLQL